MALNLPKPVNTYAGEDELRNGVGPSGAGANGVEYSQDPPRPSDALKEGVIYPPPEMRKIIDKTALHISKSTTPLVLESKIREAQETDPRFAFLNKDDPYNKYYRWQVARMQEDGGEAEVAPAPAPAAAPEEEEASTSNAYEPKAWEFKVDLPGVTAHDLDVLRLTALFHARRGRSFLQSLSVREGRNYQFDFLRPTHSLYGYYNRMVESYQKILDPPPGQIEALVKEATAPDARWTTLAEARNRAEWEKSRRRREDARAKERDEEAQAYALIDWHDFATVATIEFTQQDVDMSLPPPTTADKLRSMSMAERRMASMVMEETGAGPVAPPAQPPTGAPSAPRAMLQPEVEEMDMEDDDDEAEEARLQRIKAEKEQARAKEIQRAALESKGLKIRKDYVPKGGSKRSASLTPGIQRQGQAAMQKCPNCGQLVPEHELSEHMRIELLDPKWKEQKRTLDARRSQHQQLQTGADISASLRSLAAARTDLFGDEIDEAERRRREDEEKARRKEREKIIWDGHTNSAAKATDTFQTKFSTEDQIRKIHERLGVAEAANAVGPQVPGTAPAVAPPGVLAGNLPPALAASLPAYGGGTAYAGASISSGPTAPTPASGPTMHPARLAALGQTAPPPPPPQGQTRPREEEPAAPEPPAKRVRVVDKLPEGQLYSEIDWASLHPDAITLHVQLPVEAERPEWKLDGSVVSIPDLPVSTLFSTLRERIKRVVDADLPVSRIRIDYGGKIMNNASSLASVNLGEGDLVVMSLRKK
ncbi:SF3a splicing factor complex subunit [Cryptotrichosporon argae]